MWSWLLHLGVMGVEYMFSCMGHGSRMGVLEKSCLSV